ncbi:D-alanyl-D-alanine carboxypeptidase [Acuticoccus sp. M5D2P5]|uniref:D-alanyl-D-alanine carboxypeptidase family protein n=1 Tax=Acuticoccus kalidii TaxID=2910977 RepID=UPI001F3A69FC|nr:D-alanyl-D-alanine carboxypeptidase family protein [Acuticoccus kalidii]MCF3936282.1 D-alanyl-D-alanine carboxypeptidase [Acuticoccus kalidii]
MLKRHAVSLAVVLACLGTVAPLTARAEVGAYLLFDMGTGEVIAEHEATRPWYPASITKLMTTYVTFEAIREGRLKMTSPVRISPQAHQQPPSRMGFAIGTVITVETALRIILTKSANDVSVALAEAVGGTQGEFVDRMNATAAKLDMTASQFDNPHGLPNTKQFTSARDIALLMMALQRDFPDRADFFSMGGVRLGNKQMRNHNALIRRFPGADGMKTGFICASGFNLAASATRDGRRLGAVVLGGLTSHERDQRTAELLEKGFQAVENGGVVALDGFDDMDARLSLAVVTGERPPMGTVAEMEPAATSEVADRRSEVCGARRPETRYDEGTVATVEEVERQRVALLAFLAKEKDRDAEKRKILAATRGTATLADDTPADALEGTVSQPLEGTATAPLEEGSAPSDDLLDENADAETLAGSASPDVETDGMPPRQFADAELRPEDWTSPFPAMAPHQHPTRKATLTERAMVTPADFAPPDWTPSPAQPIPNPFETAGLRAPIGERPSALPLTYLGPSRGVSLISIAVGGADKARPDPLSGPIVGGGPPPIPEKKPPLLAMLMEGEAQTDPETLMQHAAEVRDAVKGPQGDR